MFSAIIDSSPFLQQEAMDSCLITGNDFQGDYSFVSTLRALLIPRIGKSEPLVFRYRRKTVMKSTLSAYEGIESDLVRNSLEASAIDPNCITMLCISSDSIFDVLSFYAANTGYALSGYHRVEKVTRFFEKNFRVLCFEIAETKTTILIVPVLDFAQYHYLQCGIPAYLPWYFLPDEGLSDKEMNLIRSLTERTQYAYIDASVSLAAEYGFGKRNLEEIGNFESGYDKAQLDIKNAELREIMENIETYMEYIRQYYGRKYSKEIEILGIQEHMNQNTGESELVSYFETNRNLVLESVNDGSIMFGVRTYLSVYDEDMAETLLSNPQSYLFKPGGRSPRSDISADDMHMLMQAILLDKKLRLRLCAKYELNVRSSVYARQGQSYSFEYSKETPNPHIDFFSCLGAYETPIIEYLMRHDYIGAVEQCVASCGSINLGESITVEKFMRRLYGETSNANVRCVELPDGSVVTPKQAIKYLKEEKHG